MTTKRRYTPIEEIPRYDIERLAQSNEIEAWWEWPGMFWRWSTGPVRRMWSRITARRKRG